MFLLRVFMMALRSLWVHPMRTALATLGVIIGVGAVVAAMAVVTGMSARAEESLASMGSNRIFITPNVRRQGQRTIGAFDTLKLEDVAAIRKECDAVRYAVPQIVSSGLARFLSKNTTAQVCGSTELYSKLNNYHVKEGDFISAADVQGSTSVCVLGFKVKKELFGGRPAIDETIKITSIQGARSFRVIGVMEEKGNVGFTDVDQQIIVPVTTAMDKLYGLKTVSMILAEATSGKDADIEEAKNQVKRLLRQRHKIRAGQPDDFQVQAQKEIVEQVGTFKTMAGIVLGSISLISLVVGGIGIMNIMLVAVTERTREIGVRMAMGAQRSDVMIQFLVEASSVSFLGGGFGVLMGWSVAKGIESLTRVFETITTPLAIIVALSMAIVTGVFSGIYPAWKASRLDPVEALRFE